MGIFDLFKRKTKPVAKLEQPQPRICAYATSIDIKETNNTYRSGMEKSWRSCVEEGKVLTAAHRDAAFVGTQRVYKYIDIATRGILQINYPNLEQLWLECFLFLYSSAAFKHPDDVDDLNDIYDLFKFTEFPHYFDTLSEQEIIDYMFSRSEWYEMGPPETLEHIFNRFFKILSFHVQNGFPIPPGECNQYFPEMPNPTMMEYYGNLIAQSTNFVDLALYDYTEAIEDYEP